MEFAMGWNRFNLSLLGVWPDPKNRTRSARVMSTLIFWISVFLTFAFICAPQTAYLILKSTNLDEAIENLSVNIPCTFALVKQIALRYYEKDLTWLMNEILEDWSKPILESERRVMLKNAKLSRMISIVCSILTYMAIVSFMFLQTWNNVQNAGESDLGGLLHPTTFPYDTKKTPHYQITLAGQFVSSILVSISYSSFDTFLAVLMLHLCGQLRILRLELENLAETTREKNFAKFHERLGFIVYRHNQLHRYALIVEDCFNLVLLIQTIISTTMFCLSGYRLITSVHHEGQDLPILGLVFSITHVMYSMLHLFIYCYVGETLLGESTGVAESTYVCNWYDIPPKKAISLGIIICRGRIPFDITAGKFSPVSLELFNTILKTSAGYLSVLLAVKERIVTEE